MPRRKIGSVRYLAVSVGTTITEILPRNEGRIRASFVNDSDTNMYITKDKFAASGVGMRLNANGGTLIDEIDNQGYIWDGAWFGYCSASKNLIVSEEIA